jgi:hypothetical protein
MPGHASILTKAFDVSHAKYSPTFSEFNVEARCPTLENERGSDT